MILKRIFSLLSLILVSMVLTFPCYAKERIGVLGFSGQVNQEYCQAAISKLTEILFVFGRYDLVERAEIERILEEQNFQVSTAVDPTSIVEVGKILGIKIAYIGNIDQLTASWDRRGLYYRATARVTVKVIDVQTGKILNIISGDGFSTDKGRAASLHMALERCFSERMITGIRTKIAPYSKIIKVDGDYIYFTNGKDLGITKGTRYQILRPMSVDFDDIGLDTEEAAGSSADETAAYDNTFKQQIGLAEVLDVTGDKSRAKIIWLSGSIRNNDLLQEVVNPYLGIFAFNVHTVPVRTWDNTGVLLYDNDRVLVYEGAIGAGKPFDGSFLLNWGYSITNQRVNIMNFDFYRTWELPIIPGTLYFAPAGGLGIAFGSQDYYYYSYYKSHTIASGLYVKGGLGLKYYVDHENGMQIELALIGQYGPFLREWTDYYHEYWGYDATNYVADSRVDVAGYGLQLTLNIPLK